VLDVVFNEDQSRIWRGYAAVNAGTLRKLALKSVVQRLARHHFRADNAEPEAVPAALLGWTGACLHSAPTSSISLRISFC
jgi:hypothetical protein